MLEDMIDGMEKKLREEASKKARLLLPRSCFDTR